MTEQTPEQPANEQKSPEFIIQRIYLKDLSFESPKSSEIFHEEWKPNIELALKTNTRLMAADIHEVVLCVTVTAKLDGEVAFLIEVQQAGVFLLKHFTPNNLRHMLGSYCPTILFPYAREAVSDLAMRGNFPPLALAPVDFDALYAQYVQKQQAEQAAKPL